MPHRTVVDIITGETKTVELTQEEMDYAAQQKVLEDAEKAQPKPKTIEERVTDLEAAINTGALSIK